MGVISTRPRVLALAAILSVSVSAPGISYAQQEPPEADLNATYYGAAPELTKGPDIKGFISARSGDRLQVTAEDGTKTVIAISDTTRIINKKGFLGLGRSKVAGDALLNGLPVTVQTMQGGAELQASQITFGNSDFKTAKMIHSGTAQGFAEQTAATEALRGRMADIDQYNIKGTTNVYFATGKSNLTPEAKADLCAAASQADGIKNAMMLVVGYTDSTGSYEFNQWLSEKRASRVVNYIQQNCGWKPYRMLTPTGMAEADPAASNYTAEGKAQNRRVGVNILVSKGLDGL